MKTQLALAAGVLALVAAPVLAQAPAAEHEFPMSREAFMAAYPELTPDEYEIIDADGNEEISEEEYNEAREAGLIGDPEG